MNIKMNAVPVALVVFVGFLLTVLGVGIGVFGQQYYTETTDASAAVLEPAVDNAIVTLTEAEYQSLLDLIDSLSFEKTEMVIENTSDFEPCGSFEVYDKFLIPSHRVGFFDCNYSY